MHTLDMIKQAKIDGKTYHHNDAVFYNAVSGFMNVVGGSLSMPDVPAAYLNDVFAWEWEPVRILTKAQAEQKLGVKIVG